MKAMVFAAGLGTRLRPLTDNMPKALVPVAGVPALGRVMRRLVEAGFDEIVVNVHHFPDMVTDCLRANNGFGARYAVSDERQRLLDTGGGLAKALPLLGCGREPVLVHNVDIMTDLDLAAFYASHAASGADATLLTSRRTTSRYLLFDREQRMCGWTNTSTAEVRPAGIDPGEYTKLAFGGIHVISGHTLRAMASYGAGEPFSVTGFYIDRCRDMMFRSQEAGAGSRFWHDIGRPQSLAAASEMYT